MKKIIYLAILTIGLTSFTTISHKNQIVISNKIVGEKFDIKIKNDTDNEVKVINTGSGGSYSLSKNVTTTLKMEEGDKLHYYEKGKKGALILIASKDMDGKVQLLSKF